MSANPIGKYFRWQEAVLNRDLIGFYHSGFHLGTLFQIITDENIPDHMYLMVLLSATIPPGTPNPPLLGMQEPVTWAFIENFLEEAIAPPVMDDPDYNRFDLDL